MKKLIAGIASILFFAGVQSQMSPPTQLHFLRNAPVYTQATFMWTDNSDNENTFIIEHKTDGASWTVASVVPANSTSHTFTNLNPDVSNEYRIKSANNTDSSSYSKAVRLVGLKSKLEVYPEVLGIRNPEDTTINGITFCVLQDQCPAEPEHGKATRISRYYSVEVRLESGGDWKQSPTYETRPQIHDRLARDDPAHAGGRAHYQYPNYGPNSDVPGSTLHSRHWTNFDAADNVVVRISLLDSAPTKTIIKDQLEIYPEPLAINEVNSGTIDITLPPAGNGELDFTRLYFIAFNREEWETPRGDMVFEYPLHIFVNPVEPAPASAPDNTIKEFDNGKLMVFGGGIYLPDDHWRFLGEDGGNGVVEEMYVPGDALLHAGFVFRNRTHPLRVWGRGIVSDEMFGFGHGVDETWGRTPWAELEPTVGNPWGVTAPWYCMLSMSSSKNYPVNFEGFTMLSMKALASTDRSQAGNMINIKAVGYGGALDQKQYSKSYYLGCFFVATDDLTFANNDFEMHHCYTRNFHNGPGFQYGWNVNDRFSEMKIYNHTALPPDRKPDFNDGYGQNSGVVNSRLQTSKLIRHFYGNFENCEVLGWYPIVFNIGVVYNEKRATGTEPLSVFGDKTYKNFNVHHHRNDNRIASAVKPGTNYKSYVRFLHFDSLIIEGNHVSSIDDGDYFDYNEKLDETAGISDDAYNTNGVLLHTITFFSLPEKVAEPMGGNAPIGQNIAFASKKSLKVVELNSQLPMSLSPLCANSYNHSYSGFKVVDAGGGYIALKASNGYYVKADDLRYGYLYTLPDELREDEDLKTITENAKFKWIDLDGDDFALYSKTMGLYVRAEQNCGPEIPLYAASDSLGETETFTTDLTIVSAIIEQNFTEVNDVKFFPNPASTQIIVRPAKEIQSLQILNLDGKLVLEESNFKDEISLDVSALSKGMYIIKHISNNQISLNKIIIK